MRRRDRLSCLKYSNQRLQGSTDWAARDSEPVLALGSSMRQPGPRGSGRPLALSGDRDRHMISPRAGMLGRTSIRRNGVADIAQASYGRGTPACSRPAIFLLEGTSAALLSTAPARRAKLGCRMAAACFPARLSRHRGIAMALRLRWCDPAPRHGRQQPAVARQYRMRFRIRSLALAAGKGFWRSRHGDGLAVAGGDGFSISVGFSSTQTAQFADIWLNLSVLL